MPPFWPQHFPGVEGHLSLTTWNTDGLWVNDDNVRHNKLKYLMHLFHTSAIILLQEIRFSDTDEAAFKEWLRRQAGNWQCEVSCGTPRAGGVAILWRRSWQGPWQTTHLVLQDGAMQAVSFSDDAGQAQVVIGNVHFSPLVQEVTTGAAQKRSHSPRGKSRSRSPHNRATSFQNGKGAGRSGKY